MRATDRLHLYVQEARLPQMKLDPTCPQPPPPGHKSHLNTLHVVQEPWRRLNHMHKINQAEFDEKICDWIDGTIPKVPMNINDEDTRTGATFTIACPPWFDTPEVKCRPPTNFDRFLPWIDTIPLMTAQRIMHILHPNYTDWAFTMLNSPFHDPDIDIFRQFIWTRGDPSGPRDTYLDHCSVMVFTQPPWILSDKDLSEFSKCGAFPPYHRPGHAFPAPMEGRDRLWAKIWDSCARRDCPWFVLTNYSGWILGCFSPGWSTAFSTTVFPYDCSSPTILEALLFWMHTAMLLDGSFPIPQISEPVRFHYQPTIQIPEVDYEREYSEIAPSESDWDGKSTTVSISATARWSPTLSATGLPDEEEIRTVQFHTTAMITEWTKRIGQALIEDEGDPFTGDTYYEAYRPRSESPDFADFTMHDRYDGDWLTGP